MKVKLYQIVSFLMLTIFILLSISSCSDKDSEVKLSPDRDVAETITGALAYNTCGVLSIFADACYFFNIGVTSKAIEQMLNNHKTGDTFYYNSSYNSTYGFWTLNVNKGFDDPSTVYNSLFQYQYKIQFRDAQDNPQQYYITDSDTARTVYFDVKSGYGKFYTNKLINHTDTLNCEFTITNAHTPNLVVNGSYHRAAVDSISGWYRKRISTNTIDLVISETAVPRDSVNYFYKYITGNVHGSYHANVVFTEGSPYSETNVNRVISSSNPIYINNGKATIKLGGKAYRADVFYGELEN